MTHHASQTSKGRAEQQGSCGNAVERLVLRDWINDLYGVRHGASEEKGWPVEGGGSFQDVVLRAFGDPERFLEDSANFVKSVGLLARDADVSIFGQKFLKVKDFQV